MKKPACIAFDADDTLWVNETIFTHTQENCRSILASYVSAALMDQKLYETEMRNLRLFGYGIKGFMLSMIETAIELSDGRVSGNEIQQIIQLGKEMLEHPIQLLPHVQETIHSLSHSYTLMIITKGDLFDQESKIARSGLADFFSKIEIVSEKNEDTYQQVFTKNGFRAEDILMVGNSLKSDILPVCKLGGRAVYIPFHTTWVHEKLSAKEVAGYRYDEMADMSQLPSYLERYGG